MLFFLPCFIMRPLLVYRGKLIVVNCVFTLCGISFLFSSDGDIQVRGRQRRVSEILLQVAGKETGPAELSIR